MKHTRLIVVLLFAAMFLLLSFLVSNATASAASVAPVATMPTPDNYTLIFAGIVLLVFAFIGLSVWQHSGRKRAQAQRAEWDRTGDRPEHGLIDNDPSLGANIVGYLWLGTGIYLAVAILFHDLIWLEVFLQSF